MDSKEKIFEINASSDFGGGPQVMWDIVQELLGFYFRKYKLIERISLKIYQQLKNVYKQDVVKLEKLISRDLKKWK
jgi:hypothetical protein